MQNLLGLEARRGSGREQRVRRVRTAGRLLRRRLGSCGVQSGRFQAGDVELEPGDADEALRAAAAIGDDRLQKMQTGHVMPERFTHGTSAQRMYWFNRGMDSGGLRACGIAVRGS